MNELQPLYDKKVTCTLCKHPFTTKRLRSRFVTVKSYDTDFLPTYEDPANNPNLYMVAVCPSCGFSFTEEFSPYFPPGSKELISEKITKQWQPRSFDQERTLHQAIQTLKLAAFSGSLKKEKHVTLAGLLLRLAWFYRLNQDMEQELRFMRLAIDEYELSYSTDDFKGTQMTELRLLYMIAELSRRSSQMEKATKYFSKIMEKQSLHNDKKVVEMARDRWQEMRNQ